VAWPYTYIQDCHLFLLLAGILLWENKNQKQEKKRMSSSSTLKGNGKKKKKSFVFAEIGTFLVLCFKGIWSNKNNSFVGIDPMQ